MGTCTVVLHRRRVASLVPCGVSSAAAPGLSLSRAEDLLDWLEANDFPPAAVAFEGGICTVTVSGLPHG